MASNVSEIHDWIVEELGTLSSSIAVPGEMLFTLGKSVETPSFGKYVFLEQMVEEWVQRLNQSYLGIAVDNFFVKPPKEVPFAYGNFFPPDHDIPWRLTGKAESSVEITLKISGEVNLSLVGSHVGTGITSQLRRHLAERLETVFPLPITAIHTLAKYTEDAIDVQLMDKYPKDMLSSTRGFMYRADLFKALRDCGSKNDMEVGRPLLLDPTHAKVQVIWTAEISDEDRELITEIIRAALVDLAGGVIALPRVKFLTW